MPEDCLASRSIPWEPRRRHKRRGKIFLLATEPTKSGPPLQGTDLAPIQHLLQDNQSRSHHRECNDCRAHANLLTQPLILTCAHRGDGSFIGEDPSASAGNAVRSRGATQRVKKPGLRSFWLPDLFITPHLELLLLMDLSIQTPCTAKACTMSLQGEPAASSC